MSTWGITDFKSVGSAAVKLEGERLTIVSGTNSSGKSSILQSLLLLAQSMHRGGAITLNGRLVRLGSADDVVRDGQSSVIVSVVLDDEGENENDVEGVYADGPRVSLTLSPIGPDFQVTSIEIVDVARDLLLLHASTARINSTDVKELRHAINDEQVSVLHVKTVLGRKPSRSYLLFQGLNPLGLAVHVSREKILARYGQGLRAAIDADRRDPLSVRLRSQMFRELSRLVDKRNFIKKAGVDAPEPLSPLQGWTYRDWRLLSESEQSDLIGEASRVRADSEWSTLWSENTIYSSTSLRRAAGVIETTMSPDFESVLSLLTAVSDELTWMGNHIVYLGPLRDEPRVVQGAWDERTRGLPVGGKGELTADVLTRSTSRQVAYSDWNGVERLGTLEEAVAEWCSYLGIGTEIEVTDHGKLGRGVRLRVDGTLRDLTTIGVGASQLLPVVVAVLVSESHDIVLIEQPELHLHPAVQSKLADLFLFAKPDVHFIVETHSEYLLSRARRRVAEGRVLPREIDILFVENDRGISVVRSVELDRQGDISAWPRGFFDTQDTESVAILRAVRNSLAGEVGQT